MAWIFQGNPTKFDVDDYVARYPELIYWRTPRHASQIAVGDRAFIWRSGTDAGAIALGVVVEAPTPGTKVKHPEALGNDLWRAEEPDPNEPRTGIHLQEIRLTEEEGFLPRRIAKESSELAGATIITMPNGTVFPLDPGQTAALERLWGLRASPSTPFAGSESEGQRKLRAHYRRERSNALRDKKLAEVRALHGKYVCALCTVDETSKYPHPLGKHIFEVHHVSPLARAATPVRTTLADLVLLCASCHRAVHATAEVEDNYAALASHLIRESSLKKHISSD
jgi:hypothetical protein